MDDFSTDGTLSILQSFASDRIRVFSVTADNKGKKTANAQGISCARYDRILFTDADCIPASDQWAQLMNDSESEIILGYSPMFRREGFVNAFSVYETFITAVQYLSYAISVGPYMGVGRNMLIDRRLIARHKDSIRGSHLASGDDDLTINAIATRDNTSICIDPETHVYTESCTSWQSFVRQKSRHISTSSHYKLKHKLLLGLFSGTQIAYYLLCILALATGTMSITIIFATVLLKWLVVTVVVYAIARRLHTKLNPLTIPFFDFLLFIYYLLMPFIILITKKEKRWS